MKIIAVIQARLSSTRLPRKILLPLAGKTMLENVVERVSRAKLIDLVVVACPLGDTDEICSFGSSELFAVSRGDDDLVGRFVDCAKLYNADFIVRVCADNPCVEPEEIDKLVAYGSMQKRGPSSYLILNSENPVGDFDGFGGEFYLIQTLRWMDEAIKRADYREHPHKFWFEMLAFAYCGKPYPPGFRLDVNDQADYEKLKRIYDHFGHNHFTVEEAMEYLKNAETWENVQKMA